MTAADLIAAIAAADPSDMPAILAACASRLAASKAPAASPEADELLDVDQCRKLLGKSKSWLYHNHKTLPFAIKGLGKAPRFSRRKLEEYIAKHV